MKKIISMFLSVLMLFSVLTIGFTSFAAEKEIETVSISKQSDLDAKIDEGYEGVSEAITGQYQERIYKFSIPYKQWVFIKFYNKHTDLSGIANISAKLYNEDMSEQYDTKSFTGQPSTRGYMLNKLSEGTYTIYVKRPVLDNTDSKTTNLSIYIGTMSEDAKFITATLNGIDSSKPYPNANLKVNSLGGIKEMYIETSNTNGFNAITMFGQKYNTKSGNVSVPLKYPYVGVYVKDNYDIEHKEWFGIISDETVDVLNLNSVKYSGKRKTSSAYIVCRYNTINDIYPEYKRTYKNNVKIGKATVTFKGTGHWIGSVSRTFRIIPKTPKITSLTSTKKGKIRVKQEKDSQVNGYQVKVATNKTFKKNVKTFNAIPNRKTGKLVFAFTTTKKLLSKKKYYVKVRTYKTVNGKKFYSSWSKYKTVKTK